MSALLNLFKLINRFNCRLLFLTIFIILNTVPAAIAQTGNSESAKNEKLKSLYTLFSETYKNNLDKGIRYANEALQLSGETGNKFIQVKAYLYIGKLATRERDISKAKSCYREALRVSREIKNDYLEAESRLNYGIFYGYARNMPDSALMMVKKAFSTGLSLNDTTLIKSSSFYLTVFNRLNNDPVKAITASKKALEYCKNDPHIIGGIYSELVIIYTDFGDLKEAINCYNLAIKYTDLTKSGIQIASITNKIASIEGQDFDTVLKYRRKALQIYTDLKESFGIGYTYNLLGSDYFLAGKTSEAIGYFLKAINTLAPLNSRQHLAFANSNLAGAYIKIGKTDLAEKHLQKAISLGKEIDDGLVLSDAYKTAGLYYRKLKDNDQAIKYLEMSARYAKEIKNTIFLKEIYNEFSLCYEAKGDSKNALNYLRLKNEIADTIQKQNAQKAYIEMMVKYETMHTKEEIQEAKKNVSELEEESGRKSLFLLSILGGGVLTALILTLIYRKKIAGLIVFYKNAKNKKFRDRRGDKSVVKVLETEDAENMHISEELFNQIKFNLKRLMDEEKKYLIPDLTLGETAKILNTNTTYLSKVINEQGEMNFNNYINKYRIEEAKALLDSGKQDYLTFEGIGKSCGFISRSSFNKAFKKFTGLTPTEYLAERNNIK